ncbi:MAG: [FeFe] hydrogenase H-cluster maturation GTPase HydF [Thermoguttaceae bacterium]|nr:[FeFe] hydrogenase H-cluster maturation GTPase HydF [Thermoguttaceae bacterium]MDW8078216.1 [FeFe] hydrogenase H-cluster maturation GTPase HydF [Thermoguttaceae bacterium]
MSQPLRGAPKSFRLHIGIFGRRNAGKSSLLNALVGQEVAIVSDSPGTTTDPVEKPMELQPIGPVLFIDTAGVDDEGALGEKRVEKTRRVFDRTDVALLLAPAGTWSQFEESLLREFAEREIPTIVVFSLADLSGPLPQVVDKLQAKRIPWAEVSVVQKRGLDRLRELLVQVAADRTSLGPPIIVDLVPENALVVLVIPIDKEAPKGRLIQPQVQTLRELLDGNRLSVVVKEHQVAEALSRLREPPALVVTDSQAFTQVAAQVPRSVRLTSFSILFARQKGHLEDFVDGLATLRDLRPGDRVLVAEACTHHPIEEDIGRVKLRRWTEDFVGGELDWVVTAGMDFPEDVSQFRLVIHCAACMFNRRHMLSRIAHCRRAGVPITNYGLAIAFLKGLLPRALEPFGPSLVERFRQIALQPAASAG